MPKFVSKKPASKAALDSAAMTVFFGRLAETANVSESAREAGVSTASVYARRISAVAFRKRWAAALAEGYARLEAELLAEALRGSSGTVSDTTLKSRAQKQKLGLSLLTVHRASVRGEKAAPPPKTGSKSVPEAKALITAKLDVIRDRLIKAGSKP